MNTVSNAPEMSNKISALSDTLASACAELMDVFLVTFEKVSEYGLKTMQGVFTGVKSLFTDVIVHKLNQIATLVKELKTNGHIHGFQPSYIDSLIDLQKSQMVIKMERHTFFKENFGRRVNEIFS